MTEWCVLSNHKLSRVPSSELVVRPALKVVLLLRVVVVRLRVRLGEEQPSALGMSSVQRVQRVQCPERRRFVGAVTDAVVAIVHYA